MRCNLLGIVAQSCSYMGLLLRNEGHGWIKHQGEGFRLLSTEAAFQELIILIYIPLKFFIIYLIWSIFVESITKMVRWLLFGQQRWLLQSSCSQWLWFRAKQTRPVDHCATVVRSNAPNVFLLFGLFNFFAFVYSQQSFRFLSGEFNNISPTLNFFSGKTFWSAFAFRNFFTHFLSEPVKCELKLFFFF